MKTETKAKAETGTFDDEATEPETGKGKEGDMSENKTISEMTEDERIDLVRRKLAKFVCITCDMGCDATPSQLKALPKVASLLLGD